MVPPSSDLQHPAQKRAVLGLRERNPEVTFLCISNSNTVYIDTMLKVSSSLHSGRMHLIAAPQPH